MTTKLKIDLAQGILEVEGSETFVRVIYNDFKTYFVPNDEETTKKTTRRRTRKSRSSRASSPPQPPTPPASEPETVAPTDSKTKSTRSNVEPTPNYKMLKDLDLSASKKYPALIEFTDSKFPITNEERNLVFLYYLKEIRHLDNVTLDHIYTCYRAVNIRAPVDIKASLEATASQHKWIVFTKDGQLSVTPKGREYVENYLPIKK